MIWARHRIRCCAGEKAFPVLAKRWKANWCSIVVLFAALSQVTKPTYWHCFISIGSRSSFLEVVRTFAVMSRRSVILNRAWPRRLPLCALFSRVNPTIASQASSPQAFLPQSNGQLQRNRRHVASLICVACEVDIAFDFVALTENYE